ncbi:hypothetical protein [Streptomyces sp. NPDC058953]|uniref:hypothetical protein n=1 Tax=unclassified Streptomyces TaxID=2593676 RepID=UPI0036BCF86B
MTEPSSYERRWLDVLEEMRSCPAIEVYSARYAPGGTGAPRSGRLRMSWAAPDHGFGGELRLRSLPHALEGPPPESVADTEPLVPLDELRALDGAPENGPGDQVFLRVRSGGRAPEIWYDDGDQGLCPLDLDHSGYLDALLLTRGTFGWQRLFTEHGLGGEHDPGDPGGLRLRTRLTAMLALFPEVFPRYDYRPLRRRFADRLR